ncbi:MAG: class I SAM-dependent methyltransferase [Desulfovermiculus sp.]
MTTLNDPYSGIARIYDPLLQPFLARIRWETALYCLHNNLTHVLDMGCGTGRQCIVFHRHGLQATGVDSSPAMLKVARAQSHQSISYFCLDATRTEFPDSSFDAVTFSFALHENTLSTISRLLQEGQRLLKPQGMLLITDYLTPNSVSQRFVHLGIAVIERLAGREHSRNYRGFLSAGGVNRVPNSVLTMRALDCRPFFFNSFAFIALRKTRNKRHHQIQTAADDGNRPRNPGIHIQNQPGSLCWQAESMIQALGPWEPDGGCTRKLLSEMA